MAYVPGHNSDVFVSYATVDNQRGWVTALVRELKIQLAAWLGRSEACEIWWDRSDLDPAGSMEQQIGSTLHETAILVVVLSRAYMASNWCTDERRFFLEAIRNRPMSDKRAYLVDLGNLDVETRPEEFRDYRGFDFWETDETGNRRTLGFPVPDPEKDRDFMTRVDDLARKIGERLEELRQAGRPPSPPAKESADAEPPEAAKPRAVAEDHPTVFVAEAAEDVELERNEVVRYLHQHQFPVVPQDPYPIDVAECRTAIDGHLSSSMVFAQLLGQFQGKKLIGDGATKRLARMQFERAQAAGIKIIQWRPELDLDRIRDDDHRALLDGVHVMVGELESFKSEILRLATPEPKPPSQRPEGASEEIPYVFVNNGVEDRGLAEQLAGLLETLGCMAQYQVGNGDPGEFRKAQRRSLLECDGVIYLYGCIPASWVEEQLRLLRKVVPRRKRPLKIAMCEGPPREHPPLGIVFPGMQLIDCRDGIQDEAIRPFVQSLCPEG